MFFNHLKTLWTCKLFFPEKVCRSTFVKNKIILIIIFLLLGYDTICLSQNLDSLPQVQRDSILITIAKETVLKYGPGYYREHMEPKIERIQISNEGKSGVKNANRVYYWVNLFIDPEDAVFEWGFAARVSIWADSRKPSIAQFGSGFAAFIPEVELRNAEEIKQVPYNPNRRKKK